MLAAALVASCEDHRLDGLEPDMVYLPKAGAVIEESYTIGEPAYGQLWAYKSSYNGTTCNVSFVIDEEVLTRYNAGNGTSYEMLPEDCYRIPQTTFTIEGKDEHARFSIKYYPEKIVELCGGVYELERYALPVRLTSDDIEVTDQDTSIMIFRVKEPVIKMSRAALAGTSFDFGSTDQLFQTVEFGMDFESKWDCAYTIEQDDEALAAALTSYNDANSTNYTLLPSDCYTLSSTEGVVRTGSSSVAIDVTIDPVKFTASGSYALPVILASIEKPLKLDEENTVCIVPVNCLGQYVDKTGWTVEVSSVNPNYGSPEGLIDGDLSTYWHPAGRDFGSGRDDHPNATVDMKKTVRVSCIEIDPRQDQFYPQIYSDLRCYISNDGQEFREIGYVKTPWTAIQKCVVYVTPSEGRYVKFSVEYPAGQTSIAFAELSVRGEVVVP